MNKISFLIGCAVFMSRFSCKESKYSQALRRRVKALYLDGNTYKEIAKKIMEYEKAVICMLQRAVYTDSDYAFMESELKRTEDRYERLKDYTGPLEKRLEKKYIRLKRILRGRV